MYASALNNIATSVYYYDIHAVMVIKNDINIYYIHV